MKKLYTNAELLSYLKEHRYIKYIIWDTKRSDAKNNVILLAEMDYFTSREYCYVLKRYEGYDTSDMINFDYNEPVKISDMFETSGWKAENATLFSTEEEYNDYILTNYPFMIFD